MNEYTFYYFTEDSPTEFLKRENVRVPSNVNPIKFFKKMCNNIQCYAVLTDSNIEKKPHKIYNEHTQNIQRQLLQFAFDKAIESNIDINNMKELANFLEMSPKKIEDLVNGERVIDLLDANKLASKFNNSLLSFSRI